MLTLLRLVMSGCLASVLVGPIPLRADIVEYEFAARIVANAETPIYGIYPQLGEPVYGRFSYDTSVPPALQEHSPFGAYYWMPPSVGFTIHVQNLTIECGGEYLVWVYGDQIGNAADVIDISAQSIIVNGVLRLNGTAGIAFLSSDADTLADISLPTRLPFKEFDVAKWGIVAAGRPQFEFAIHTLTFVPTPRAFTLLAVGVAAFACGAFRKHRHSKPLIHV